MAINTFVTNIIVEDNTFDYGVFTPNGLPSSSTTYGYFTAIATTTNTIISNNYISGTPQTTNGGRIAIFAGSATITGNTFIRENITIPAYITSSSSDDQIITNNIFDSPTVDGTSEVLVTGLSSSSTYHSNKNQTGSVSVPMTTTKLAIGPSVDYMGATSSMFFSDTAGYNVFPYISLSEVGYKSLVLFVDDFGTIATRYIGWQESLDKYLPPSVRVLKISLAMKSFEAAPVVETPLDPPSGFDSNIYLYLNQYNTTSLNYLNLDSWLSSFAAFDPSVVNDVVIEQSTPVSSVITGAQINANTNANAVTASVDTTTLGPGSSDISSQFVTGRNFPLTVSVDIRYKRHAGASGNAFFFAPLYVKYRW